MTDWFATPEAAAGYASARPAVHPRVLDLAWARHGIEPLVQVGLDVGCGAGLSTRSLADRVVTCLAFDPSTAMVQHARATLPHVALVTARAEAVPFLSHSVDMATAAGSLDFVDDLPLALAELLRLLRPGGHLLVYDFGTGRVLRDGPDLGPWFADLLRTYPRPMRRESPPAEVFIDAGFASVDTWPFTVHVSMSRDAYVAYLMTETNVGAAIADGVHPGEVSAWLTRTIPWPEDDRFHDLIIEGHVLTAIAGPIDRPGA